MTNETEMREACRHEREVYQYTGDGAEVAFCPECGSNRLTGHSTQARARLGKGDAKPVEVGELSPCEFSTKAIVNFIPTSEGVLHRIAATKNAVVIQLFYELRDEEGNFETVTHIECKDAAMKAPLMELAKKILSYNVTSKE